MNRKKLLCTLSVIVILVIITIVTSASAPASESYVDSREAVAAMSEEEVIAIGKIVATCENGELPDHAFAVMFRLQEIDPELAEACFENMSRIAAPAVAPKERTGSFRANEPERFGAYVRNGNGGYYEYDEYENADTSVEGGVNRWIL